MKIKETINPEEVTSLVRDGWNFRTAKKENGRNVYFLFKDDEFEFKSGATCLEHR